MNLNPGKEVFHMVSTISALNKHKADICCDFLNRVCNLNSVPTTIKNYAVDEFSRVKSIDELYQLCKTIEGLLQPIAANPDYFTV